MISQMASMIYLNFTNMTAQEFLKKALKEWVALFEGIKLKYAYDAVTEYHIVEVKPEEIRRGSVDYKRAEMQLWMDFMEQYPDECLLICAPSEANDMTNVLFETRQVWTILVQNNIFSDSFDYTPNESYNVYSKNTFVGYDNNNHVLAA